MSAVFRALLRGSLVTLLVACASLVVHAQSDAARAPRLRYRAMRDCPSRASFEASLRAHASRVPPDASATPPTLEVQLRRAGARAVGELVLEGERGSEPARRKIEAATCAEAADALAFVAALLLEQRRAEHAAATTPDLPRGEPTAATPAPPAVPTPPSSTTAVAAAPTHPANDDTPAAARLRAEDEAPVPTPAPERTSTVRLPRRASPSAGGLPSLRGELLASALLASGFAPAPAPAVALAASLGIGPLLVRAGLRASLPQRVTSDEGNARFGLYAGTLAACGELGVQRRLTYALCAVGELGRVVARGEDTSAARRVRRTWAGVGPRAQLSVRVVGPLRVEPGVELIVPLARDRYEVGDLSLHRVPSLTFRAELAIGVRFE